VIDVDLSVSGVAPPLHLPVMAGLAQGPGFPNLSCLGLLSDRILHRYVAVNEARALTSKRSDHAGRG
jgi:mycobactin lysine-N-oxygenase